MHILKQKSSYRLPRISGRRSGLGLAGGIAQGFTEKISLFSGLILSLGLRRVLDFREFDEVSRGAVV